MTLHVTLTYHWFDKVESGKKTAEYRKFCAGWAKRLEKVKAGDFIVFHRGYTDKTATRKITDVSVISSWNLPQEEYKFFGCPNEEQFFKIDFEKE